MPTPTTREQLAAMNSSMERPTAVEVLLWHEFGATSTWTRVAQLTKTPPVPQLVRMRAPWPDQGSRKQQRATSAPVSACSARHAKHESTVRVADLSTFPAGKQASYTEGLYRVRRHFSEGGKIYEITPHSLCVGPCLAACNLHYAGYTSQQQLGLVRRSTLGITAIPGSVLSLFRC